MARTKYGKKAVNAPPAAAKPSAGSHQRRVEASRTIVRTMHDVAASEAYRASSGAQKALVTSRIAAGMGAPAPAAPQQSSEASPGPPNACNRALSEAAFAAVLPLPETCAGAVGMCPTIRPRRSHRWRTILVITRIASARSVPGPARRESPPRCRQWRDQVAFEPLVLEGGEVAIAGRGQQDIERQIGGPASAVASLESARRVPDPLMRHSRHHSMGIDALADDVGEACPTAPLHAFDRSTDSPSSPSRPFRFARKEWVSRGAAAFAPSLSPGAPRRGVVRSGTTSDPADGGCRTPPLLRLHRPRP